MQAVGWRPVAFRKENNEIFLQSNHCFGFILDADEPPCKECWQIGYSNKFWQFVRQTEKSKDHTPWLLSRAAHHVCLRQIDRSVTQELSPYCLGLSQVSWWMVDIWEKAVWFCQVTGLMAIIVVEYMTLVAPRPLLPSNPHVPHEWWAWPLIFLCLHATFSISDDLNCFFCIWFCHGIEKKQKKSLVTSVFESS